MTDAAMSPAIFNIDEHTLPSGAEQTAGTDPTNVDVPLAEPLQISMATRSQLEWLRASYL